MEESCKSGSRGPRPKTSCSTSRQIRSLSAPLSGMLEAPIRS